MPLEDDIEAFRVWATKLGCPPDFIPGGDALKSIFKSRQRGLFCDLVKRVQPRQYVQEVRENILIKEMEKLKDQVVPVRSRNFLPKEVQTLLKIKDLQKKKEEVETRFEEYKQEYDAIAASIKTKNLRCINLEHRHETIRAKVNLLEFKRESLDKSVKIEEKNKEQIIDTMPVKLSSKNASESGAMDAVKSALKELDAFYNFFFDNNSPHSMQNAKEELWKKMRSIFADVPNFLIFNAIMRLKEDHLQNIMSLNKSNLDKETSGCVHSVSGSGGAAAPTKEPFSPFELKLMKTKVDLLGIVAKYLAARNECAVLEERFANGYGPFVDELQKKVNLFNVDVGEDYVEDIISDYIVQFNLRNFSKSQNEFLAQQIEQYKAEIESDAKPLEKHEVLLGSIKQVYSDISASINRIQYEMIQLNQIKEKILYSKNMMKHMLDNMQASCAATTASSKSNFLPTKLKVSSSSCSTSIMATGGGGDSFELGGNDLVFCSTKLDFDSTITSLNNTTMRCSFGNADATLMPAPSSSVAGGGNAEERFIVPPHSTELFTFNEIPLEKFNYMPKECAFYLSPNPFIVELCELSSTKQLAPGILLTPFGALQEVCSRIMWADLIAKHSNELKLDLDLIMVDPQMFKQKIKQQREHIEELLDRCDVTAINTKHTLQKVERIYKFTLENPMRNYIPASKCFNNQTYADYDAEFTMYYRMATVGTSIKS